MRPFSIDDLYLHRKLTALHAVAAHAVAVGAVRSVDRDHDGYTSALWCFPLQGGAPWQLTRGPGRDASPRLSPDGGRVAFTSDRAHADSQIYLIALNGGEAWPCGHREGGFDSPRWAPDGRSLLATGAVAVDPDLRGSRRPVGEAAQARRASRPELAWRLPYKADGTGYLLARELHLFRIDAASGEHSQLTDGPFDVTSFDPSPDNRRIAFVRTRDGRLAHRSDLWVCDADGSGARQLTDALATVLQPVWSPDGRCIAFAGAEREGESQTRLYVYDLAAGRLHAPGPGWVEVAAMQEAVYWSADSSRVVLARASRGTHEVVSLSLAGDAQPQTLLAGERQFGAFVWTDRAMVYSAEHPTQPSELYTAGSLGQDERRLSDLNGWWRERTPLQAQRRAFEVPDGRGGSETIEGWLIRAAGSPRPQPLLDDAHGGPASYALLDFDTNVFWQVLCSQGWAVLALNPVGSSSYGRDFCTRLAGHWGELDLPQHLAAIAQLQQEGLADDRLAIAGKSYGGFFSA